MHDCSILIFVLSYLTYLCIDKLIHIWYQYQQLSSVNFATNIPSSLGDFPWSPITASLHQRRQSQIFGMQREQQWNPAENPGFLKSCHGKMETRSMNLRPLASHSKRSFQEPCHQKESGNSHVCFKLALLIQGPIAAQFWKLYDSAWRTCDA